MPDRQDHSVDTAKETVTRRGRPRGFAIEQAVETAQALFHERGYDHVGVTRLAKEIGIEQPSLYAAFGNKLGIFEAVVERYACSDGAFIADAFANANTVQDGLRALLTAAATTYSRDGASAGCMIMEGAHGTSDEAARALCAGKRAATQAFISDYVDDVHPGSGPEVAAMTMIALAGLSASARVGMTREALLRFGNIAGDGLIELLANPPLSKD